MENFYSDLEGLRIAVEIEKRGKEFYRQAYEQTDNKEHKNLFFWLMGEEAQHIDAFSKMYDAIKEHKNAQDDEYLYDAETSRYLTVLAETHVFPPEDIAAATIAGLKSVPAILRTAMQAEKDSILFYDELALHAKFDSARDVFIALKREEQQHVVKLREMIEAWA